jgi:hypothetical protein
MRRYDLDPQAVIDFMKYHFTDEQEQSEDIFQPGNIIKDSRTNSFCIVVERHMWNCKYVDLVGQSAGHVYSFDIIHGQDDRWQLSSLQEAAGFASKSEQCEGETIFAKFQGHSKYHIGTIGGGFYCGIPTNTGIIGHISTTCYWHSDMGESELCPDCLKTKE